MGKGRAARERRFADLALLFASISVAFSKGWATPFEGLLLMKNVRFLAGRGVYLVEGRGGVSQTLAGGRGAGLRVLAGCSVFVPEYLHFAELLRSGCLPGEGFREPPSLPRALALPPHHRQRNELVTKALVDS